MKDKQIKTCDNCAWMTIISTGSGNHRRCEQMGIYIPDEEQFPTCAMHTKTNSKCRHMAETGGER